jgi:hypothetical protein
MIGESRELPFRDMGTTPLLKLPSRPLEPAHSVDAVVSADPAARRASSRRHLGGEGS